MEARKLDPTGIVAFRQGDIGEYLREVRFDFCKVLLRWHLLTTCFRRIPFLPHNRRFGSLFDRYILALVFLRYRSSIVIYGLYF